MSDRVTIIEIEPYHPDGEVDNEERAAMARPFAEAWLLAHYESEALDTVIGDLIVDLLHLCDRLDAPECEYGGSSGDEMLARVTDNYFIELREEGEYDDD